MQMEKQKQQQKKVIAALIVLRIHLLLDILADHSQNILPSELSGNVQLVPHSWVSAVAAHSHSDLHLHSQVQVHRAHSGVEEVVRWKEEDHSWGDSLVANIVGQRYNWDWNMRCKMLEEVLLDSWVLEEVLEDTMSVEVELLVAVELTVAALEAQNCIHSDWNNLDRRIGWIEVASMVKEMSMD